MQFCFAFNVNNSLDGLVIVSSVVFTHKTCFVCFYSVFTAHHVISAKHSNTNGVCHWRRNEINIAGASYELKDRRAESG